MSETKKRGCQLTEFVTGKAWLHTIGSRWKLVSDNPAEPVVKPQPSAKPEQLVEPEVTQVADGEKLTYQGKCFVAKNTPDV